MATGATLDLNGFSNAIGSLSDFPAPPFSGASFGTVKGNNAAGALTILVTGGNNTNTTFSGVIQDGTVGSALRLVKTGTGTQTLAGKSTYTGGTLIANGTLTLINPANTLSAVAAAGFGGGPNFVQINDVKGTGTAALTVGNGVLVTSQTLGNGITFITADTGTAGSASVVNITNNSTLVLGSNGAPSIAIPAPGAPGAPTTAAIFVLNNTSNPGTVPTSANTAQITGTGRLDLGGLAQANFVVQGRLGQSSTNPAALSAGAPSTFGDLTVSTVIQNGGVGIYGVPKATGGNFYRNRNRGLSKELRSEIEVKIEVRP